MFAGRRHLAGALDELQAHSAAGRAYNLGSVERPRYVWVLGDETSTTELIDAVRRCIRERPLELSELETATDARRNRLSGAIVRLQAFEEPIMNLGTQHRARWFLAAKRMKQLTPTGLCE